MHMSPVFSPSLLINSFYDGKEFGIIFLMYNTLYHWISSLPPMLHSSYYTCKARYFCFVGNMLVIFPWWIMSSIVVGPTFDGYWHVHKNTSNKTLLLLILLFLENTVIMTMRSSLVVHYILLMGWIHPQLIPYWSCSSSTRSEASWCLNLHFHAHFFEVILFQIMSFRNCAFFQCRFIWVVWIFFENCRFTFSFLIAIVIAA